MFGAGPLREVFFRAIEEWLIAVGVGEKGTAISVCAVGPLIAFGYTPAAGVGL